MLSFNPFIYKEDIMKKYFTSFGVFLIVLMIIGSGMSIVMANRIARYEPTPAETHTLTLMRGNEVYRELIVNHGASVELGNHNPHYESRFWGWAALGSVDSISSITILRNTTLRMILPTDEILFRMEFGQEIVTTQDTIIEFVHNISDSIGGSSSKEVVPAGARVVVEFQEHSGSGAHILFVDGVDIGRHGWGPATNFMRGRAIL